MKRFIETILAATDRRRARGLIFLGPADEALLAPLTAISGRTAFSPPVHLFFNEDLAHVAALVSLCAAYVGNDSGISHLAAAVGTPILVLFGPTNPAIWAPRGGPVTVLRAPNGRMDQIPAETVIQWLGQVYR